MNFKGKSEPCAFFKQYVLKGNILYINKGSPQVSKKKKATTAQQIYNCFY